MTKKSDSIHEFIIAAVAQDPAGVARRTCEAYRISRQAVNRHLRALLDAGLLEETGHTRAKTYRLRQTVSIKRQFRLTPALREHRVWRDIMHEHVDIVSANVRDICQYAFTEVLNNAIDHSGASRITVALSMSAAAITLSVTDDGKGIFSGIAEHLGLDDAREVAFELAKGRLSTAPDGHAGLGLFFATKACDKIEIQSERTTVVAEPDVWSVRDEGFRIRGTSVRMRVSRTNDRELNEVFDTYAGRGAIVRTQVPLALLEAAGGRLVSRSQAQRVIARLDDFEEVYLDFAGVEAVGPAFADEIFRAFRAQRPGVTLVTLNASSEVRARVRASIATEAAPTK